MSAESQIILAAIGRALTEQPFADPVNVCGALLPRTECRAIEAKLLRQRVRERRAA